MPPPKKRKQSRDGRVGAKNRQPCPIAGKEYDYVLQLSAAESELLSRYQNILSLKAAHFAETYYNYLFDNPDIADVLYAYERQGGNIGQLVREQLEHMLHIFAGDRSNEDSARSEQIGRTNHKLGIKPVWSLGASGLFLNHVQELIANDEQIESIDRKPLETAFVKMVFRDMGISNEGYWRQAVENLTQQLDDIGSETERADDLLSSIPHLLWTVDVEANKISYASEETRRFCGQQLDAPIPCFYRIQGTERERVLTAWQQVIDGESVQLEVQVSTDDDQEESWYRMAFYPKANRRGRVLRVHCVMEDVSVLRKDRERLEQLSTQDEVTGLANRTLWFDHLGSALAVAKRNPGASVAVMMLDINQFKMYNDSLGHQAGDELLRQVASRLQLLVRDTDTVARLGGDEFGIVLPTFQDAENAAECVASKIVDTLSAPFTFGSHELCLSGAMGIAIYPKHGEDAHSLASHADSAMYRAKWNSVPYLYYEVESSQSAAEHLQFSGQLHGALERQEFELHYQPMMDLTSGGVCGVEALLRWQHPEQGLVFPDRFISVIEQLGMMTSITDWVLETALAQSKTWQKNGTPMPASINVSARSFQSHGLVDRIKLALDKAGVDGRSLEIEITEATLMNDLAVARDVLKRLNDLNVRVAIDDFGTGYSSLAYLRHLPIDTLKIDQSFLQDLDTSPKDMAIVRSIIELGHNLGCTVVAEGVEHESVHKQLQTLGCDQVQGFHISKPLPGSGFQEWLAQSAN